MLRIHLKLVELDMAYNLVRVAGEFKEDFQGCWSKTSEAVAECVSSRKSSTFICAPQPTIFLSLFFFFF